MSLTPVTYLKNLQDCDTNSCHLLVFVLMYRGQTTEQSLALLTAQQRPNPSKDNIGNWSQANILSSSNEQQTREEEHN